MATILADLYGFKNKIIVRMARDKMQKIALGGGCHWCTEAVFQSLKGVVKVEQGYVAAAGRNQSFSEAVIVHYSPGAIPLETLIEIHLYTHNSTTNHSMRDKYRSAIYTYSAPQTVESKSILKRIQSKLDTALVTVVLPFSAFKPSRQQIQDYYYKNPNKPFCKTFVNPKLKLLLQQFAKYADHKKLKHLKDEEHQVEHKKQ